MLAVFTVSVGFGVVLPFLPDMWGRLADWRGARGVLLVGLLGSGITTLVFSSSKVSPRFAPSVS